MEIKKKDRFNAELLRAHLVKTACSQRELATHFEGSHTTIQNWLRGGLPGRENLRKLAAFFDVDPHDFLADPFDLLYSHGYYTHTG
jgi:transcriptional regulator with XRE-family HTH domain